MSGLPRSGTLGVCFLCRRVSIYTIKHTCSVCRRRIERYKCSKCGEPGLHNSRKCKWQFFKQRDAVLDEADEAIRRSHIPTEDERSKATAEEAIEKAAREALKRAAEERRRDEEAQKAHYTAIIRGLNVIKTVTYRWAELPAPLYANSADD
jgi:hypothetical protein